jgi:hypothetical protein
MHSDETTLNLIAEPHLYLCSRVGTQDRAVLTAHNITYVLNVTERAGHQWEGIKYLHLSAKDGTRFDLSAHFPQAHDFISSRPSPPPLRFQRNAKHVGETSRR